MAYYKENVFGGKGSAPHQFSSSLRGISVDPRDLIYAVGDTDLKIFDSEGKLQRHWSTEAPGYSVYASTQELYVGHRGQLAIYDQTGKLLNTWRDSERLGLVTAIGLLEDYVLIADSKDRCIRRYDKQGNFLNNIGKDNRMKGFNIPNGSLDFAVDRAGVIHACNPGKHRVERYTAEGELLGHIGRFSGPDPKGFSGCCNPTNVAVTEDGMVFVTEKALPRAKALDSDGNLVAMIASDVFDTASKNMDIAVDSRGRVYVADTVQLQIHVFAMEIGQASGQGSESNS
jgi:sugar lactone lactonase YvrE